MRFLLTHRSIEANEAGVPPSPALMEAMGALLAEMTAAGVLITAEGLLPSSKGARLTVKGGKRTVIDGPYAKAKEVLAGFALINVKTREEAIAWASRFAEVVGAAEGDVDVEIRQLHDLPGQD